jgi:tetratricopeptide (TPR) repeat protein
VPWGHALPTNNLEAYDDLLRAAEYNARFTLDDSVRARAWIEKAIALDPESAGLYAALAGNYSMRALFGWSSNPAADLDRASQLAQKALTLDDTDSGALATLCEIHWLQRRFDQAIDEGEHAVALDPNNVQGYGALVDALTVSNRSQDELRAIDLVEKEIRLDPSREAFYDYFIAAPYVVMRRYEAAIPLLKSHLAVYPNMAWAHAMLISAYIEMGRDQEARAEVVELKRISPNFLAHAGVGRDEASNSRFRQDLRKAGLK